MNPTKVEDKSHIVVKFTNIASFDFTGILGARYGGRDFFVAAGKSKFFPFPLGDHLATHLARQIILRNAAPRDDNHEDGRGGESKRNDRPIMTEESVAELKKKIITTAYEEEQDAPMSEMDIMERKVKDLNSFEEEHAAAQDGNATPDGGNGSIDVSEIASDDQVTAPLVYQDKADVIAELEKRGITFDARAGKEDLQALLG